MKIDPKDYENNKRKNKDYPLLAWKQQNVVTNNRIMFMIPAYILLELDDTVDIGVLKRLIKLLLKNNVEDNTVVITNFTKLVRDVGCSYTTLKSRLTQYEEMNIIDCFRYNKKLAIGFHKDFIKNIEAELK